MNCSECGFPYPPCDLRDGKCIGCLHKDNQELNALFDLQRKRTLEADELWRSKNPGNELVCPDLGVLLTWLMNERASAIKEMESFTRDALSLSPLAYEWRIARFRNADVARCPERDFTCEPPLGRCFRPAGHEGKFLLRL